jgi:hypothetical protein
MQPSAMAIWCTSAVRDDGAALSDPRAPSTPAYRAGAEGEIQVKWTRDPGVLIRIIGFLMGVIVAVWLVKNGSPVR